MHSLSRWLITVFVGMFLAVLAGGVWFYHAQERRVRQEAERTLLAVAKLKVNQIAQWRAERLEDAATLQGSGLIVDGFWAYLANPRSQRAEEMRARLRSLGLPRQYSNVMLVDAQGKVCLAVLGRLETLPEPMAQCVAAACRQRRCAMTDLHVDPGEATPHVDLIVPLNPAGEGSADAAGAIILRCDAKQTLYPLVESWPTPSWSAESLLVRREADDVVFLNGLRHEADTAMKRRIPLTRQDVPAVLAVSGKEGVVNGSDYRGVPVVAALSAIPDSPWFLVAKMDVAEALSGWRTRSILIVAAVLGLLASVTAATGVLWQRSAKHHYRALFHSELSRRQEEEQHHTTLLSIGDGVITTDDQGRVELLNPVAEALTGWKQDQARGQEVKSVFHIINEETRREVESPVARVLREGVVVGLANHTLLVARDGVERPIADSGAPVRNAAGDIFGTVLVFRDQSQQRKSQAELSRLNRALRAIGECNQVLVRATQEPRLLDEICRIIHEIAGYPVVYVSMAQQDPDRTTQLVAHAGGGKSLLESFGITWSDAPSGRGPTGTAIRTGRPCLVRDSDVDSRLAPWREKMRSLGIRSLASFPLVYGQEAFGAVTMGAVDGEAFTAQEVELLGELAGDLAYGINAIRASGELSGRQAMLASLFRAAPAGIGVIDRRIFREVNDTMCEMVGYAREELIGRSTRILYHSDEEFERVGRVERHQMAEKGTGTVETRWRRRDGTDMDVLVRATPLTPGDLSQGVTFTALDITDRKQAEDALRESVERYRVLFSVVPDALFLFDTDTLRILDADEAAEKMYGYGREELLGLSAPDISANPELSRQKIQSIGMGQKEQHISNRHRRKDGSIFPVEITTQAFLLEGRRRVFVSVRDISERQRAEEERAGLEEQLRQSQRLESIGRLAGGVAHDFNNLLTPILGYSQLLRDPASTPEMRNDGLEQIHQAARRAKELTMQLLAFGRKQIMELKSVDLRSVVASVEKLLGRTLREDIRLETHLPPALAAIRADAMQMEQVLMNLAVNAQDAMAGGGVLTIEVAEVTLDDAGVALIKNLRQGRYILMSVSDTGIGIAPADLEHIFEPFFTTKEKGKGVGLGLATVFGIVKQHGGGISAYSEPGQGSTFKVYLPVAEDAVATPVVATDVDSAASLAAQGGNETILVVEDHEAVLAMIKRMLTLQGYRVLAAQGPAECMRVIRAGKEHIHLMLTDVVMTGMNGRELYEQVSAIRPNLKVIYMSGHTENAIAHHGVLDSGIAFIQKPFSTDAILRKIRQVLDA